LSYLDKGLDLQFKNPFRKWSFKKYIYKQKTFVKFYRGLQVKSHNWIRSKLLTALETGEILETALCKVIKEGPSIK